MIKSIFRNAKYEKCIDDLCRKKYNYSKKRRRIYIQWWKLPLLIFTEQVVHIGDSLSSDVQGASFVGINTIWLNRKGREIPEGVIAVKNLLQVYDTDYFN